MERIQTENWNPGKMCHNLHCSSDLTHFEYVEINGMKIVVCLCEKHSKKWEDEKWKNM